MIVEFPNSRHIFDKGYILDHLPVFNKGHAMDILCMINDVFEDIDEREINRPLKHRLSPVETV